MNRSYFLYETRLLYISCILSTRCIKLAMVFPHYPKKVVGAADHAEPTQKILYIQ